jgi:adenylosuccinate synthase
MVNSATQIAITKLDTVYQEAFRAKSFDALPVIAKEFLERIEMELKTPVAFIGTGSDAEDLIDRRKRI